MLRLPVSALLTALLFSWLLVSCNKAPPAFRNTVVDGAKWGKDFELTAHTGQKLRSADYQGRVQILFFGYTHCPDICAPTLAKLAQVIKSLGTDAQRVQVFFISVDPVHDTPEQLKKFLTGFDPSFIGLTGSPAALSAVAADHVVFFKQAQGGKVEHSGMLFVKDAQGRMRLLIKESAAIEDMTHDLRLLLRKT